MTEPINKPLTEFLKCNASKQDWYTVNELSQYHFSQEELALILYDHEHSMEYHREKAREIIASLPKWLVRKG